MSEALAPAPGLWQVWRHGGRVTDRPRLAYQSADEALARARYQRLYAAMRQGEVRLVAPDGRIVARAWAPTLRSRW
ncbi:MAG: hypothetical protein DIU69_08835 [Bacillota bacterium]|nr:MAG: hypothetical protein DIU69_08835 [Bacillota bacterium]